jgi:hypothetical protein
VAAADDGIERFAMRPREHKDDGRRVYLQTIEQSVLAAVNSRTSAVLGDWKVPDTSLDLKGRNLKGLNGIR